MQKFKIILAGLRVLLALLGVEQSGVSVPPVSGKGNACLCGVGNRPVRLPGPEPTEGVVTLVGIRRSHEPHGASETVMGDAHTHE